MKGLDGHYNNIIYDRPLAARAQMWLFLLFLLAVCAFTVLLHHLWIVLHRRPKHHENCPASVGMYWQKEAEEINFRQPNLVGQMRSERASTQQNEESDAGRSCIGNQEESEERENQERENAGNSAEQPPIIELNAGEARRQSIFSRCNFRTQIGQGPIRFIGPEAKNGSWPGVPNSSQLLSGPSTSSAANQQPIHHPHQANSALCVFFEQLLSNLGVNLSDGNVYIFAEQDHNIVWVHLGRGANDGLYAIHANSFDDKVTEFLEKFTELFVPTGLLPYELSRMPRVEMDAGMAERSTLACNICLNRIVAGEQMTELKCQHFYHSECIHAWLLTRNTCPTCRAPVFFEEDPAKCAKEIAGVFV